MRKISLATSVLLVLTAVPIGATDVPVANDAKGFSKERLNRLGDELQRYVDDERIAGAVTLILHNGAPVYERAVGWSDKEAGRRMQPDTIFRIASQTKGITSAAALTLVEEGKLLLSDPVSRYVPAFERTTVSRVKDGHVVTEPAKRQITVFDLITHTSGISYGSEEPIARLYAAKGLGPAAGFGWYTLDKDEPICRTMERLAELPFVAQPGEEYVYGYGIDVLGCVIERASGQSLDEFVRARITTPLALSDTHFFLPPTKRARFAAVYGSNAQGRSVRAPEGAKGQGHFVTGPRRNFQGGAGLVSTAHDYARFLEALRRGGEIDGKRILSPRSVALMRTNQVGALYENDGGLGFGLAFETVERYGALSMASVGSYGWDGAYGSLYHVDPQARLVAVLMIQLMPNETDLFKEKFLNLIYQAMLDDPDER